MDERAIARRREIDATVAEVREIERRDGVTRASLEKIKQRLIRLAARQDLFTARDFPPPEPRGKRNSCLYRVSEDTDHRFAPYVNSSFGNYVTQPHNPTTSAVIVGVTGEGMNHFDDRALPGL